VRYLLVIQFSDKHFRDLGEITVFEGRLTAALPRTCKVDGHDIGSGATNFFVFTRSPFAAHRSFRKHLGTRALERRVRVAFRAEGKNGYWLNLWPFRDARPFALTYDKGFDPFNPMSKRKIRKRSKPGVSKLATRPTSKRKS
jgi:hypothetical protein